MQLDLFKEKTNQTELLVFVNDKTANYVGLMETSMIEAKPISFDLEVLTPGDKIIQLGSKKRARFKMQDGHFLEYAGILKYKQFTHLLFKSDGLDIEYSGYWIFYSFVFVNPDTLIIADNAGRAWDIRVDAICRY